MSPEKSTNDGAGAARRTPEGGSARPRRSWVWWACGALVATLAAVALVVLLSRSSSSHPAAIGVVECDDYLARMDACTSKLAPSAREQAVAEMAKKRATWEAASSGPARDALKGTCQAEMGTMPIVCGPIGIWACDTYLLKMEVCIAKMDPAARSTTETSFKETRAAWQAAVRSGANIGLLQQGCEAAVAAIPPTCR